MALGKKKRGKTAGQGTVSGGAVQKKTGRGLSLFDDLDHLFEDFLKRRWPGSAGGPLGMWHSPQSGTNERVPSVDVADKDDAIVVRAELPGVRKEDLDVSIVDRMVTIRATRKEEKEVKEKDFYRREIHTGEFSRSMLLPTEVDVDKATASFTDGIMELTLPKVGETRRRKIRIGN
jgi:HSP20 family protein